MIKQIVEKIYIRPIKQKYFIHDLGPKSSTFRSINYEDRKNLHQLSRKSLKKSSRSLELGNSINQQKTSRLIREDHIITTPNTSQLHVSFYKSLKPPFHNKNQQISQNVLVYLHTHNGSRLQGLNIVEPILSMGLNVCIFDFSGYGNSKGTEVSLGVKEIYDLDSVLQFLEQKFDQIGFILWGRSMGAVTALRYMSSLLYTQNQYNILGGIYDSPFASLQKLTFEMSSKNLGIPEQLLSPFVMFVKSTLKQKLLFDDLELENKMSFINIPGLFVASKKDSFISYEHSEKLYQSYGCRSKEILFIQKDHNQSRTLEDLNLIYDFIQKLHFFNQNKESITMNKLIEVNEQID